jgi:hypothetical protein
MKSSARVEGPALAYLLLLGASRSKVIGKAMTQDRTINFIHDLAAEIG